MQSSKNPQDYTNIKPAFCYSQLNRKHAVKKSVHNCVCSAALLRAAIQSMELNYNLITDTEQEQKKKAKDPSAIKYSLQELTKNTNIGWEPNAQNNECNCMFGCHSIVCCTTMPFRGRGQTCS